MHLVVIVSYLSAAAAFLVGTLLLAVSWRGQRIGAWLVLAMAVSVLWAIFLAYAEWRGTIDAAGILDAEILRYGAWLAFVTALFRDWPERSPIRALRIVVHGLWVLLLLYLRGRPAPARQAAREPPPAGDRAGSRSGRRRHRGRSRTCRPR